MVSERVSKIQPSATLSISAKAKSMQANGVDVLNFSAGEPDFEVRQHIREAARTAIDENFSYYTPSGGIDELKEAVISKLARENNIESTPKNVIITNGGKEALFMLFQTLLNEGDEVVVPTPYWVSYYEQISYAGGRAVFLSTDEAFHFTLADLAATITDKTKAILLNSPSNPAGAVVPQELIKQIAELVQDRDLWVITDEVYEHFLYDGHEQLSIASLPGMAERTVVINAISKTYCMTGWRVGYAVGPEGLISGMTKLKSHLSSNTSSIAQKAAVAALAGPQDFVAQMRQAFNTRRLALWEGFNAIDGCSLKKPEGAFYGFLNFAGVMERRGLKNSFELCEALLEQQQVALVPGEAFGTDYTTYARFSFATATEYIQRGLERLVKFAE